MELHQLGPIDETAPTERDEIGLIVAPAAECRRPLLGTAQVEDGLEGLDRGAVDDPGDDRRNLAGGDCDHRLIEEGDAPRRLAHRDQRLAASETAERRKVRVAELIRDGGCAGEQLECARRITSLETLKSLRNEEITALDAVRSCFVDQARCPGEPAAGLGKFAALAEPHHQVEGVAGGSGRIPRTHRSLVCLFPGTSRVVGTPEHVGRDRQAFEIGDIQRSHTRPGRQLGIGVAPRLSGERLATKFERVGGCHRLMSWPDCTSHPLRIVPPRGATISSTGGHGLPPLRCWR